MKAKSLSFLSTLAALLFAGPIVNTLAAVANIVFTDIVPSPGQTITSNPTRFAARVVDLNGNGIQEVKLLFRVRGSSSKYQKTTLVREANNVWGLPVALALGGWEWYLEAKNSLNVKRASTASLSLFTFTRAAPVTPTMAPVAPTMAPVTPQTTPATSATGTVRYGLQDNCNVERTNRYDICLDLVGATAGAVSPWMDAFALARADWEAVIVGNIGSFPDLKSFMENTGKPIGTVVPNTVDDMYIVGKVEPIDGVGMVLGSAGPTVNYVRSDGTRLPVAGQMRFDSADVTNLMNNGRWAEVIKHEMGHVLGIGTRWRSNTDSSGWFTYTGTKGTQVWREYCPNSNFLTPPIENDGGQGTKGGHWDETCFNNELMTGWLQSGTPNPMSVLTVAALEDMGYAVSYASASSANLVNSPCCRPSRRNLRRGQNRNVFSTSTAREKKNSKPMSEEALAIAAEAAANHLSSARDFFLDDLPDGLVYVGGDSVTIMIIEDDMIKEATFEWSEVSHLVEDVTPTPTPLGL